MIALPLLLFVGRWLPAEQQIHPILSQRPANDGMLGTRMGHTGHRFQFRIASFWIFAVVAIARHSTCFFPTLLASMSRLFWEGIFPFSCHAGARRPYHHNYTVSVMPNFHVKGVDKTNGEERELRLEADNEGVAAELARNDGVYPTSVHVVDGNGLASRATDSPRSAIKPAVLALGVIGGLLLLIVAASVLPGTSPESVPSDASESGSDAHVLGSRSSAETDESDRVALEHELNDLRDFVASVVAGDQKLRATIAEQRAEGERAINSVGPNSELGRSARRLLELRLHDAKFEYQTLKDEATSHFAEITARLLKEYPASDGSADTELAKRIARIIAPAIQVLRRPL